MHLVQLAREGERGVAIVRDPELLLLAGVESVYALAQRAIREGGPLTETAALLVSDQRISYDDVYNGASSWKLLPPVDVPGDPQKVLVTGTGLTHLGSARERQAMHAAAQTKEVKTPESEMTDSMRMFEWGRERGRPAAGAIGVAPEWFYKGDGSVVRAPFAPLEIPGHAEDGGEEGELAAIYVTGEDGTPYRLGFATGNEFSDHIFERRNYLNLAGSKLRMCSLGPELVIGAAFQDVAGSVRILRGGEAVWGKKIRTGEANMAHSLQNLEHHHFKFAGHRQPGMLHVHFLGADALSFGDNVRLREGDVTEVQFEGFGRALVNPISSAAPLNEAVRVQTMS